MSNWKKRIQGEMLKEGNLGKNWKEVLKSMLPSGYSESISLPTILPRCNHWRTEVRVRGHTILASGLRNSPPHEDGKENGAVPGVGIYLDHKWSRRFFLLMTPGSWVPPEFLQPRSVVVVNWPDQSTVPLGVYRWLVDRAFHCLPRTVEIGCEGGHGRTGTLLAGLLVRAEGLGWKEAIATVRERYCFYAVETPSQAHLVREYWEGRCAKKF